MSTPIPGQPIKSWEVMRPVFDKWPWAATSLRRVPRPRSPIPDGVKPVARPLSTLFAVADLDDQVYLWVAGCEIHACTMEDLIRYRLDLLYWESQLTFVFDANLSWFGAISDEDDIYLYGDWERAKRV